MIHSRKKDPQEIFEFCLNFRKSHKDIPLMVVPSSFNSVKIDEWEEKGVNIVCYANHMLRSAYPAMLEVATKILQNRRTLEVEKSCMPIKEILDLIPGTR